VLRVDGEPAPAALFSFYDFRARGGVVLAQSLVDWRRTNRGGYRPFLHQSPLGVQRLPDRCGYASLAACRAP